MKGNKRKRRPPSSSEATTMAAASKPSKEEEEENMATPDEEGGDTDEKEEEGGINPEAYTKAATERLLKELKELRKEDVANDGLSVQPIGDNLYKWHVKLFGWDQGAQIKEDLMLYESVTGRDHVLLEIIFPKDYPALPPFIRVVYPRFHQYTGHITIGGSICVKDLTRSGWNVEFQLRPFFVMIRNLLLDGGALVDMDNAGIDYSEQEAREAFDRVAQAHGWTP